MTSQDEHDRSVRIQRRERKIGRLVDYGLESTLRRAGFQLDRVSIKAGGADYLMTLVLTKKSVALVAFVGAETMGGLFLKAADAANRGELKVKPDKYRT